RCRRGSLSIELQDLAFDLDLVAGLRAGCPERGLQLLAVRSTAGDAEAAVGAEDPEWARAGRRPVDEELGKAVPGRPRLRLRNELEQAAPELVDPCAGRTRRREDAPDALVFELECRRFGQQVELVEDDHLSPGFQAGAVLAELAVNRPELLDGIARGGVDDVHEQTRARQAGEEPV